MKMKFINNILCVTGLMGSLSVVVSPAWAESPMINIRFEDPNKLCGWPGLSIGYVLGAIQSASPNTSLKVTGSTGSLKSGQNYQLTLLSTPGFDTITSLYLNGQGGAPCGGLTWIKGGTCDTHNQVTTPLTGSEFLSLKVTPVPAPLAYDPSGGYTLNCSTN